MLTVKRTGAQEYGRFIKILICGFPGAGKTLISSTWPNPIYAAAEPGLMSIADRDIPFVDIKTSDELLALRVGLDQSSEVREKMFGFPVDTVVIDTIDEIQRILIRERLEETKKDALVLQDWGWLGEQMKTIIRSFRNLDLNVVMTCHIKETQDSESGKVFFKPDMQGAIGDQVSSYVDLALLLKVRQTSRIVNGEAKREMVRYLQSYVDAQHPWVKDRSGKLPQEFPVNFTDDYDRLNELIFGHLELLPPSQETIVDSPAILGVDVPVPTIEPPTPSKPTKPTAKKKASAAPPVDRQYDETPQIGGSGNTNGDGPLAEDPATGQMVNTQTGEVAAEAPIPTVEVPATEAKAPAAIETAKPICVKCGKEVESTDQADLSRIRFREILCKADFAERKLVKK